MQEPTPTRSVRAARLELRLSPQARQTLSAAARASHRSVSRFVLETALPRAEATPIERRHLALNAARWDGFVVAPDAPPRDVPRSRRLFRQPAAFEPTEPG